MRRILSSIDIGTNSIKLVVAEIIRDRVNILCAISEETRGIKNGLIENFEDTVYSIKKALKKAEELLGLKIKKVVAAVPEFDLRFTKGEGVNSITNDDGIVTKNDISRIMQTNVYNKIDELHELITVIPIDYRLDDNVVKKSSRINGK